MIYQKVSPPKDILVTDIGSGWPSPNAKRGEFYRNSISSPSVEVSITLVGFLKEVAFRNGTRGPVFQG